MSEKTLKNGNFNKKINKGVLKTNCVYFNGYKPCKNQTACFKCGDYKKKNRIILIIKFGALGDALRTTPILRKLKKRNPECYIIWLTDKDSYKILKYADLIDELLVYDYKSFLYLKCLKIAEIYSFDKDKDALAAASLLKSASKTGFGLNMSGNMTVFNKESEYAYFLGLFDELKFKKNQKSYQEILFEMCGFKFNGEKYVMDYIPKTSPFIKRTKKIKIGINTGSGLRFKTKDYPVGNIIKLINLLYAAKYEVYLLGGPLEKAKNQAVKNKLKNKVIDAGCGNTLEEFMDIINSLDLIITADTLAMHLAAALNKKNIVLMGSTSAAEIELYGSGNIINKQLRCSPCYKTNCLKEGKENLCMKLIKPEEIVKMAGRML